MAGVSRPGSAADLHERERELGETEHDREDEEDERNQDLLEQLPEALDLLREAALMTQESVAGVSRAEHQPAAVPPCRGASANDESLKMTRAAAGGVRPPSLRAAVGGRLTRFGGPRREFVGVGSEYPGGCLLILIELDDPFAKVRCWTAVVAHVEEAEQQQPLRGQKTEDVVRLEPERLLLVTRARHPPLRFRT